MSSMLDPVNRGKALDCLWAIVQPQQEKEQSKSGGYGIEIYYLRKESTIGMAIECILGKYLIYNSKFNSSMHTNIIKRTT